MIQLDTVSSVLASVACPTILPSMRRMHTQTACNTQSAAELRVLGPQPDARRTDGGERQSMVRAAPEEDECAELEVGNTQAKGSSEEEESEDEELVKTAAKAVLAKATPNSAPASNSPQEAPVDANYTVIAED